MYKNKQNFNNLTSHQIIDYYQVSINKILVPLQIRTDNHDIIDNIGFNEKFKTIFLFINPSISTTNKILIEIPRAILDSKTIEGKDKNFNVTINNKPAKFLEVNDTNRSASHNFTDNEEKSLTENLNANANNRNLLIEFDKNSKVIEITGTNLSIFKNVKQNVEKPTEENTKIITSIVSIIIGIVIGLTYFIIRKRDISFIKKFRANK